MRAATDILMTPDQLGEIYQVSGRTIRRWFAEGRFPAEVNSGRTLRFDAEQVAAGLKAHARKVAKQKSSAALA